MVQVIQAPRDPRDAALGQLANTLGGGLGSGLNNYFINRSLDSVLKDKSLDNAPQSVKMGRLEEALRPYGEKGQQVLQNRFMLEQQAENEKSMQQNKKKGDVLRKRLSGEKISDQEKEVFSPEEEMSIAKFEQAITLQKLKNEGKAAPGGLSGQSVPPQVSNAIQNVLSKSQDLNADELTQEFDKEGVPRTYSNAYVENRRRDDDTRAKKADEAEKLDYQSFKDNREYSEKILNGKEAYERDKAVLDQMAKISKEGDLPTPLAANLLQKLGLPLGLLENPSAEQFEKLSQELMKNIMGTYGSRILQSDVVSFMKSIPTLLNSPEGQKRLIKQWQILNEGKKIYYDSYKDIRKENPKRLPPDLHEQVLERSEPKLEEMANKFRSMNMFKTVMDPNGVARLIPEDQVEAALKAGGRLE
jgi:hypothetical protein